MTLRIPPRAADPAWRTCRGERDSRITRGDRMELLAAASSMARGNPLVSVTRRATASTSSSPCSAPWKEARSKNIATPGDEAAPSEPGSVWGGEKGRTTITFSASMPMGSRLVTTTATDGHHPCSSATIDAASGKRCSRLSRTTRHGRFPIAAASSSSFGRVPARGTRNSRAMAAATCSAASTPASSTIATPNQSC